MRTASARPSVRIEDRIGCGGSVRSALRRLPVRCGGSRAAGQRPAPISSRSAIGCGATGFGRRRHSEAARCCNCRRPRHEAAGARDVDLSCALFCARPGADLFAVALAQTKPRCRKPRRLSPPIPRPFRMPATDSNVDTPMGFSARLLRDRLQRSRQARAAKRSQAMTLLGEL